MKECIACAEEIRENAQLCRYCNTRQDSKEFLRKRQASEPPEEESAQHPQSFSVDGVTKAPTSEPDNYSGQQTPKLTKASSWPWFITGGAAFLTWILYMTSQSGWRWSALRFDCIAPADDWAQWSCGNRGIGETWTATIIFLTLSAGLFWIGARRQSQASNGKQD